MARFANREQAQRAIERLSRLGIDAARIHKQGRDPAHGRGLQRIADVATARRLGRLVGRAAIVGIVVGAVFGAAVVAVADAGAAWAGALGGAGGGLLVGALVGAASAPTMSRAWEQVTASPPRDPVTLVVDVTDDDARRVHRVLARTSARHVGQVRDRRGLVDGGRPDRDQR